MKLPINLLLFCLFACNSFAQIHISKGQSNLSSYANPDYGIDCIAKLSEGTLIVRLSVFTEKIKHLQDFNKEKAEFERERIEYANKSIMKEFNEDYSFSKVLFTYGNELDQFLHNEKKDVFLNENLQFDPSLQLMDGPVFILATKSTSVYKLCDVNFIPIREPAIEYVSQHMDRNFHTGFAAAAQGFREFSRSGSTAKRMNKMLKRYLKSSY